MLPTRDGRKGKSYRFLKHPFFLLLFGTILSCLVVPWISEISSHRRLLQEQRVNLAADILKQALLDDQQLSTIHTTFEFFYKEQIAFPLGDPSAPKQLHESFAKLYSEFDRHAWWWDHDLPLKSVLLGLPSDRQNDIKQLHDRYKQNLFKSVEQVEKLRVQFCAARYQPNDPRNAQVLDETGKVLEDLAKDRGAIASQMARIFMPPRWSGADW
ncbi:MAG TPA: hypothetical protein VJX30_01050 [Terriglobales bacterium]|jgi:hypothetical protein|nr:hypothetical protein [Terriglobales bacterium]